MRVHEAIGAALTDRGVDTMFGLVGGGNVFMVDRFVRDCGGRYVGSAHEAGAVLMAIGYASSSGRLGVATVSAGPGLTNCMTALVEGVRKRAPLLLIVADTPGEDRQNIHNIDQREIVKASGAAFEECHSADGVVDALSRAIARAVSEHCTVALNIPEELMWVETTYAPDRRSTVTRAEVHDVGPDPAVLDRAVGVLATARRPIVLAGRGAMQPEAREALLALAGRLSAPVATTLQAKDLFRGETFDLGLFGTLSHDVAVDAILQSDCIVAFGASLNSFTTAQDSYLESRRVIQCDIDRSRLGALTTIDVGIVGGAAPVARTMIEWLDQAEVPPTSFASSDLAARLAEQARVDSMIDVGSEFLDIRNVLKTLDRVVPQDRILVTDAGRFMYETLKLVHVTHPQDFVHAVHFGSVGLSMGNAIGAAVAAPGRPVLAVCGDGGFMMSGLTELNTAVRHGLDLIVVVCNDRSYGAEHVQFRDRDMDPALVTFDWPDLAPVAEALGATGLTIRSDDQLDELAKAIEQRHGPLLIDLQLDPDTVPNLSH